MSVHYFVIGSAKNFTISLRNKFSSYKITYLKRHTVSASLIKLLMLTGSSLPSMHEAALSSSSLTGLPMQIKSKHFQVPVL